MPNNAWRNRRDDSVCTRAFLRALACDAVRYCDFLTRWSLSNWRRGSACSPSRTRVGVRDTGDRDCSALESVNAGLGGVHVGAPRPAQPQLAEQEREGEERRAEGEVAEPAVERGHVVVPHVVSPQ